MDAAVWIMRKFSTKKKNTHTYTQNNFNVFIYIFRWYTFIVWLSCVVFAFNFFYSIYLLMWLKVNYARMETFSQALLRFNDDNPYLFVNMFFFSFALKMIALKQIQLYFRQQLQRRRLWRWLGLIFTLALVNSEFVVLLSSA